MSTKMVVTRTEVKRIAKGFLAAGVPSFRWLTNLVKNKLRHKNVDPVMRESACQAVYENDDFQKTREGIFFIRFSEIQKKIFPHRGKTNDNR